MNKDMCVACDDGILNVHAGAIIMKDGKLLMVSNGGDYLYSVGGRLKFGETAKDTVVREVLEETGVQMEIDRLGFVHENYILWRCAFQSKQADLTSLRLCATGSTSFTRATPPRRSARSSRQKPNGASASTAKCPMDTSSTRRIRTISCPIRKPPMLSVRYSPCISAATVSARSRIGSGRTRS